MKKTVFFVIICFLFVSVKEIKSTEPNNDASDGKKLLSETDTKNSDESPIYSGYRLFKQQKYDEAKIRLIEAIENDPKSDNAYTYLGIIFSRQGERAKAIEAFNKAIEINPENSEAHFNVGIEYYNDDQFYKSLAHLKKDLLFVPSDHRAISVMGNIYFELNDVDRALEYFIKSETMSQGNAGVLIKIADCYQILKKPDAEIETYRKILELQSSFYVYYRLGIALGDKGDAMGEVDAYKMALLIRPDHVNVTFNLGLAYYRMGEYELALGEFLKIRDDNNIDSEVIYHIGLINVQLGNISDAWESYEILKKTDPERADEVYDTIKLHEN